MALLNNTKLVTLDNLKEFLNRLGIIKKINIGSKSITASNYKSEITFVAGDNVTLEADDTNNKITISSSGESAAWTGTKAEWNALTDEEKASYSGKIINLTDDYTLSGTSIDDDNVSTETVWSSNKTNTEISKKAKVVSLSQEEYDALETKDDNTYYLIEGEAGGSSSGTITEITMNGVSKGTSGVVDLGNVVTYSSVGTTGQFATSDGNGGITWVTLDNAEEVAF